MPGLAQVWLRHYATAPIIILYSFTVYMWPGLTKKDLSPTTGSPTFDKNTYAKLDECTIRFQCQVQLVITGLLLLSAPLVIWAVSGAFMVPWAASSELCAPVKSHGARWRPVVLICHPSECFKPLLKVYFLPWKYNHFCQKSKAVASVPLCLTECISEWVSEWSSRKFVK